MYRIIKVLLLIMILNLSLTGLSSAHTYTIGDINADYKVDMKDLLILSLQWLEPSGCFGSGCADLDGLNGINMDDFALLAGNWLDIRTHLVISEFMATNGDTILDGNNESSDWIEIYNPTDTVINLDGWYLTDDDDDLTKWQFPNGLEVEPGKFLIVFASEKTFELYPYNYPYVDPAGYYHTNFNLDKDPGEYLAIVAPDGKSVVHEYAPRYPEQLTDISYGLAQYATTLVPSSAIASFHIPTSYDVVLGTNWTEVDYDDSAWDTGPTSIGFGSVSSTGSILREYWTGIPGSSVSDLTGNSNFPDNPSGSTEPVLFEAPLNWSDDYGMRMQGFVHPPTSGDYTFWISSDDGSELWLSTDTNPANTTLIASVSGWTNSREWTTYASQQSSSVELTAGQKYYIEALQKEGGGGDNLAVTWEGPGINYGNPIEGQYLSPWTGSWIATDVNDDMRSINSSLWLRIEFELEEGQWETFDTLALRMIYEDGFVAYINGQEVASRNAPDPVEWNSTALSDRPNENATDYEFINLTAYLSMLSTGINVLSIHGLNDNKDDGNFLILPELVAARNVKEPQYFATATPGTFNVAGALGRVGDVWFSHEHGFYSTSFQLNLYPEDEDVEIRYTFDGSRPTIMHGLTYTGPIDINEYETTTIRAVAVKPGWLDSNIETHTYLLNADPTIKGMPLVSLVGDYEETFYEPNGVMAIVGGSYSGGVWVPDGPDSYNNPMQRGMAFERPASFELINPWNNTGLQADSGLRVHGSGWMRPRYRRCGGYWTGDCKFSFRLYFRNQYGDNRLEYPLFPFKIDSYKSIVLRGGHNDRTNPFIKDELIRRLHMDMGHCASGGIMANLLINGEYKGYFNPCEHIKSQFCQEWFGSDKEWDVMTMNGIRDGETVRWDYMLNYARNNDLSDDAHYQEVGRHLDIAAFADYLILQLWSGNWDWPQNNWAAASERSEEGRWRFFIWDAEGGMFSNNLNTVYLDRLNSQGNANGWLYQALKVNINFRQLFADRVYKHFFNDGALTNANIEKRFYELRDEMISVLPNMDTYVVDTWTPQRWNVIYNAFVQEGIYFTLEAPAFHINGQYQHGGQITTDDELTMDNPNGSGTVLYYTTDGSDPRLPESMQINETILLTEDAVKKVLVPTGPVNNNWRGGGAFDDSNWNDGTLI
ncbi:MAG: FN3 associated domain-containing protein, partial [Planctomycetota bacterium]